MIFLFKNPFIVPTLLIQTSFTLTDYPIRSDQQTIFITASQP